MLVLSRKPNEGMLIGDDIAVVVMRITGRDVSLGIRAPADVAIVRGRATGPPDLVERDSDAVRLESFRRRQSKRTFLGWSFRFHAERPAEAHIRLGLSALHRAFPGASIFVETGPLRGESLRIAPPSDAGTQEVNAVEQRAEKVLRGVFARYLPYDGWSVRYITSNPEDPRHTATIHALQRTFRGADVHIEPSGTGLDRLMIVHPAAADSDALLDAYVAGEGALAEAEKDHREAELARLKAIVMRDWDRHLAKLRAALGKPRVMDLDDEPRQGSDHSKF